MSKRKNSVNDRKYHYTYRITNIKENKHYYGVRSSKDDPKLDLGIKYFSSSSNKEFIKEQKENKDIFKYKIIKIFETREEAVELEMFLHNKYDVGVNENFYNKVKQTSTGFDTTGKAVYINEFGLSEFLYVNEAKKRGLKGFSAGYPSHLKGKKLSSEHRLKLSESHKGDKNHNYGIPKTDEIKQKISNSNKGKIITDDSRQKLSESQKGKIMPVETREKISIALSGRVRTEEHCKNISNGKKGKKYSPEACANMSAGQKGKHVWNKGLTNMQSHSEETKNILSAHFSNTKWINNNVISKRILEVELEQYLNNGWLLGRRKKGISNG